MKVKINIDIKYVYFVIILSVVFSVLKIIGIIKWSWALCLSPIWGLIVGALAIVITLFVFGIIFNFIAQVYSNRKW